MKKNLRIFALLFLLPSAFLLFCAFDDDHDPLHKRSFTIGLTETRNGVIAKKVIMDKLSFKDGKIQSEFLKNKFGFKYIRYRINKDSFYVDETNTEVRLLEVEASATDEANNTVLIEFTTVEWDIDGIIKITKNDRLKRYYDMAGREKGGKPKKIKKKENQEGILDGTDNSQANSNITYERKYI
jgi:hypothetical protein